MSELRNLRQFCRPAALFLIFDVVGWPAAVGLVAEASQRMKFKYGVGEKVLCFEPDETKARVLYNAKIMDADIIKDVKGKKYIEYKIHFQGWNHAWDRWAEESFVLKDDEQNRKLQKKLARRAFKKLKQKGRRRHLPGVASKQEGNNLEEVDSSSGESVDSDMTASTSTTWGKLSESEDLSMSDKSFPICGTGKPGFSETASEDASLSRDEYHLCRLVALEIPASLQRRLEEDSTMIKRRNMLVSLPTRPNVVQILENYVKKFAIQYVSAAEKQKLMMATTGQPLGTEVLLPPDKRLNLCQEVCCDLKLLFDYALPLALLYLPERDQYKHMIKNTKLCRGKHRSRKRNYSCPDARTNPMSPDDQFHGAINTEFRSGGEIATVLTPTRNQRSLSESSDLQDQPKPKKKSAEELLIEETHKYLIPNQPNLDQTGLSKDSMGRRRSSRLSHHDSESPQRHFPTDAPQTICTDTILEEKSETLDESVRKAPKYTVAIEPCIFLRAPRLMKPSINSTNGEGSSCSSAILPQPLYNANPRMNRESYLSASGSDIKNIVELKKIWDWCIVPESYQPEEGSTVPPSHIYGVHHLLRLFVKLPDILMKMEIPEFKLKVITKHLSTLLKFLNEYERELFEVEAYVPADFVELK